MSTLVSKACICRNCNNSQTFTFVFDAVPELDEAIATCKKCGFKSVWFDRESYKYHKATSCNKCAGNNDIKVVDNIDGCMSECSTVCKDCGFVDYWAYGCFESGSKMESNCDRY